MSEVNKIIQPTGMLAITGHKCKILVLKSILTSDKECLCQIHVGKGNVRQGKEMQFLKWPVIVSITVSRIICFYL